MQLTRRGFMGGIAALVAATGLPSLLARAPILYGDGVHDDTGALSALFVGEPVRRAGGGVLQLEDGVIRMPPGRYKIRADQGSDRDPFGLLPAFPKVTVHN